MLSRPLAFAVLTVACMAAAAGGAYLAMQEEAAEVLPVATAAIEPVGASEGAGSQVPTTLVPEPAATAVSEAPLFEPVERPATTAPRARRAPAARPRAARTSRTEAKEIAEPLPPLSPITDTAPATTELAPEPPPQPRFEELTIPAETVIGVQVDTTVSSERAQVEDRVEGRVTRDVLVDERVAIPAGTKLTGAVTMVERGGKFRERARIAVRFHTATLHDGTSVPLSTTAIMREGDSPARESAAKVGGSAVGGAILGAILGGAKGAVIGGTAGAGAGGAIVAAGGRNAATLPAGTHVTIQLMSDVAITIER